MQHCAMDDLIALADLKIENESVPRFSRHVYFCCLRSTFHCIRHSLGAPLYSAYFVDPFSLSNLVNNDDVIVRAMTIVGRSHDWFICYARVFLETESTLVSAAAASGVHGRDAGLTSFLCHVASTNLLRMIRAQMAHEETIFHCMRPFAANSEPPLKLLFISRIPTQVLRQRSMSCSTRVMSPREGQFVTEQSNVFSASSSHEPLVIHVRLPSLTNGCW